MSLQPEESDPPLLWSLRANRQWRNLVAYWLLGLCNNYGYVVMLSAAHDILSQNFNTNTGDTISENVGLKANTSRDCNPTSTGEILLADILPGLIIKIVAPFFTFNIHARILLVVLLEAVGFILVAFATADRMALLGVVSTSLGSGLGEVTLLSYSTFFDKNVVSTWSSGTGGAGILGASSYAGLTSLGLSPSKALLIMLSVLIDVLDVSHRNNGQEMAWQFEMIDFHNNNIGLSHSEQYRWLQVLYQVGVFVSRSSVNIIKIHQIWLMCLLQVSEDKREFSMGITSLSDAVGIGLSGFISIPVHNVLCQLPRRT
uniref:Battenin n=1 Tax=Timema bartmani TaxID=61472 RepID=A0A7R9F0G0_9NEOP|nr:unnamed protein product [Timema bartmani]